MQISVVIPAYNEEKRIKTTLEKILRYLDKNKFDYELIVVDDCSADNTINAVKSFKNSKIRILKNNENMGKGYSVKRGVLASSKENILFSDADLSTPIEELDKFLEYTNNNDIIIASRNLKESNIALKQPFFRSSLGKIFPFFVNLFVLKGIKDTQCGFKLFKSSAKKIFEKQKLNRFAFDVEILYLAEKSGLRIKELPVRWINSEGSKVNPLKDPISMFYDLIKIKINEIKGKYNE
jgi:dolichyl-phosphate beta-glucosyltransferase